MRLVDLLAVEEVPPGTMKMAWVDGADQVLVVNLAGDIRAFQGICSHEYFELDKGFLTRDSLTCALHLSRFDLETGEPLDPPAEVPIVRYPVIFEGGRWHTFAPLSLSRPVFMLKTGMGTLLDKQVRHLRPTRLSLWMVPTGGARREAVSTLQYGLPNNDGSTWADIVIEWPQR